MFHYRDLKPDNVLVTIHDATLDETNLDWETIPTEKITLKISDFGLGRFLTAEAASKTSQTPGLGTKGYMAPEIEGKERRFDEKADVWSYGVIMHELAVKEKPKKGIKIHLIILV